MSLVDCDILVVGAGPSGVTAAKILAEKGFDVLVLDKKKFPRPKLCAGLLTWKTLKVLKEIFQADRGMLISKGVIHYQTKHYVICNRRSEIVRGQLDFPFHFVDRKIYDQFWLEAAREAGAEIQLGEGVVDVDPRSNIVTTDKGRRLQPRAILGADGVQSRMRSCLVKSGSIKINWPEGLAFAIEASISRRILPAVTDRSAIYFGFIPWGYAWSFPGPENQVIGICGLKTKVGPRFMTSFKTFYNHLSIPAEKLSNLKGYPLPYGNYLTEPGCGNALLLGDACGLADPLLGEGIYYAHRSGQIAAEAVQAVYPHCDAACENYVKRLNQTLIPELKTIKILRNIIFHLLRFGDYRLMAVFIKMAQKKVEEAIQGQRSFRRFSFF